MVKYLFTVTLILVTVACGTSPGMPPQSCIKPGDLVVDVYAINYLQSGQTVNNPRAGSVPSVLPRYVRLMRPIQVAARDNDVFVLDPTNGYVFRINMAMQNFTPLVAARGQGPRGLYVDHARFLYIVDDGRRLIDIYRPDGQLERSLGQNAGLVTPIDVLAPSRLGEIVVADQATNSLLFFNRLGEVTRVIGDQADRRSPFRSVIALAEGPAGIYVLDSRARAVHIISFTGQVRGRVALPDIPNAVSLAIDRRGRIFIADQHNNDVFMLDEKAGNWLTLNMEKAGFRVQRITDLWSDENDFLYVVDSSAATVTALRVPSTCP